MFDSGCSDPTGASAVSAAVANTQHGGVIGPLCSSATGGALPVLESVNVVMLTGASTAAGLKADGSNVFNRTVISDPDFDPWDIQISGLQSVADWEVEFASQHGYAPWLIVKYYYVAMFLLLSAIEQVGVFDGGGNLVIDRTALANAVCTTLGRTGVTGSIVLDVLGTRVIQYKMADWSDDFGLQSLEEEWLWIDESPTHWSLSANPGFLRILTQSPTQNRLVQSALQGDFEIRSRVLVTPTENFQFAGISIYTDENI